MLNTNVPRYQHINEMIVMRCDTKRSEVMWTRQLYDFAKGEIIAMAFGAGKRRKRRPWGEEQPHRIALQGAQSEWLWEGE